MKTKTQTHTPGPFAISLAMAWQKYHQAFGEVPHGTTVQLAAMLEFMPDRSFAAAPDMVKALTSIMFAAEHGAANPDTLTAIKRMARAAIAKAE